MKFHPFEVSIPHIIYAVLGGFVVFFGMFSLFIRERLYIGEACWAFVFGVVIGPYGANIFDPRSWGGGDRDTTNMVTLEITRVVLAIGVFAIGVELPKAYMARHWKSLLFLLAPVMTWGWFVSAGLIYALIPGLNFLSSLAVAACLTPTDPILAAAVVGGKYADKHVPAHLRHLLAAESGCNDGAAYPFLFLALYLIVDSSTGRAVSDWFLLLWLYQVILGIVFGACIGVGFRYLMRFCERKDLIDRQSYVAQYVSLAMLTIGSCTLLGTDDLLAAFSCGAAFAWDGFFNKQTEESVFSSVIDLLFNIATFVFVGAWTPFHSFSDATLTLSVWRLIVIGILVILLRRLPVIIALYRWIPDIKSFREAVFSGHFGPMGVGAVYISTLAAQQLPRPSSPPANQTELLAASIQPIVAFMVLCSILIHGLSIPFFSVGHRIASRTWSRRDTWGRGHPQQPEWANLTRHIVRGQNIVINRDATDLERGEATMHGAETPLTEKIAGSSSSQTQTQQDEETRTEGGGDIRDESPPDGREIMAEWKEGPHRIIERRAGPGEEVEVEVQENAYGPDPTIVHSLRLAEDRAKDAARQLREKVVSALEDPRRPFDQALENTREGIHHEAHRVEDAVENLEQKTKRVLSPSSSSGTRDTDEHAQPAQEDEEEAWLSDGEGETRPGTPEGRRQSRSPKLKPPKLAILRPAPGARRRSIRRGMFGARVFGRHQDDMIPEAHRADHTGDAADVDAEGDSIEREQERERERERERGRRRPTSATVDRASVRLMHNRIDSLRSLDERSRRSHHRDASPSRSIRWADTPPDSASVYGPRSGTTTPGILSPSSPITPLPGSEAPSDEDESPNTPTHQVRFSVPDVPPSSSANAGHG